MSSASKLIEMARHRPPRDRDVHVLIGYGPDQVRRGISFRVWRGDRALRHRLNAEIERRELEIHRLFKSYAVPLQFAPAAVQERY